MKLILAALLVIAPAVVLGACPNACSGHGTCGEKDMCTCHTNWQGGDCSERICPSNWAWVTTSNGDINYDGDRNDGTEYQPDYHFEQGTADAQLITQKAPNGDWENWPLHAKNGEGHFYMECSNRGLCNRQTGECECFPGYTGSACRRSVCPSVTAEECSGHGTCETIAELAALASSSYSLWDKDMQRSCLCDPGYTGIACNQRLCPYGDDVLTKNQITETQWVEVGVSKDQNTVAAFDGQLRFQYTDYYGEVWTTSWFNTAAYDGTNGATLASDAQAALAGLPNNILNDPTNSANVAVSAGWCGTMVMGDLDLSSAYPATETGVSYAEMRCEGSTPTKVCKTEDEGTNWYLANTASDACDINTASTVCFTSTSTIYNCVEYRIDFQDIPGNLNLLTADTSGLTVSSKNNYQDSTIAPTSSVSNTKALFGKSVIDNSLTATGYLVGDKQTVTCASHATDTSVSGKTLTCAATTLTHGDTSPSAYYDDDFYNFGAGELVHLECGTKSVGYFTVASTPNQYDITFQENIPSVCDGTTVAIKVSQKSETIVIHSDVTSVVSVGDHLQFASGTVHPTVIAVGTAITDSQSQTATRIQLSFQGAIVEHTIADTALFTTETPKLNGQGTTESNECSDRGLCNRETGICECFAQYTGDACELQDALQA